MHDRGGSDDAICRIFGKTGRELHGPFRNRSGDGQYTKSVLDCEEKVSRLRFDRHNPPLNHHGKFPKRLVGNADCLAAQACIVDRPNCVIGKQFWNLCLPENDLRIYDHLYWAADRSKNSSSSSSEYIGESTSPLISSFPR